MTSAEKIGKLAADLAGAALAATAKGDDVHALFFSIKAAECLTLAKALGWKIPSDLDPTKREKPMTGKWRDKRSFGPIVRHEDDGSFRAICTWCVFRVGDACTHVKPARRMHDPENTPEWCELREDMLRDAKEMARDRQPPSKPVTPA